MKEEEALLKEKCRAIIEGDSLPEKADGVIKNKNAPTNIPSASPVVELKRNIGFISCLGILVGSIMGSGIFVSPKGVLIGSGSVGASLIVWALCGVMTFIGSMIYAELGALVPNSGGPYFYLLTAFNPKRKEKKSFWGSLCPFLFFWQFTFLVRPVMIAVQGMASAQYIMQLTSLGGCGSAVSIGRSGTFTKLLGAVFIMTITAINCHSNKISTRLINLFTFAKLLAVFFVIVSGITKLSLGTNEALKTGFEGTTFDGLAFAFYSGFWAFAGWEQLNLVTRELVNPKRDLPRSLAASCIIVTSIYLLMNVSYYAVLSKGDFLASDAVAVDFAERIIGKTGAVFIIASVASSIFGSTLGASFTGNRVLYAAAREGHVMELFSYIHYERMVPTAAIVFNGVIAMLLIPQSSVLGLIGLVGFVTNIFTILATISLFILRKNKKSGSKDFQVPIVLIVLRTIAAVLLAIYPIVRNPQIEYIFVLLFMFVGVLLYTIFVYLRKTVPGLHSATLIAQKILLVVPSEDNDV